MPIYCEYRYYRYQPMHRITHPAHLGATLQSRRKALKLSQAQVAERLGLSQNRLSELEANPETFTAQQLLSLLKVLGLEMSIGEPTGDGRKPVEW
jgi:HTH-type transcriptional regulator / antitoxin HipB